MSTVAYIISYPLLIVTIALILGLFIYSFHALIRDGEVLIKPNLLQPVLFCFLYFLIYVRLGPDYYTYNHLPNFFDWVEFTIVHILRAGDIFDIIEEYQWNLQNIRHTSVLVATIIMAMHWMVDIFLIGIVWKSLQQQGADIWDLLTHNHILDIALIIVWFILLVTISIQSPSISWFLLNGLILWPLDNLLRVVDVGDSFQLYHICLHEVPNSLWNSMLAVLFRALLSVPAAKAINWIHLRVFFGFGKPLDDLVNDLKDAETRQEASAKLSRFGGRAVPILVTTLENAERDSRIAATAILGNIGPKAAAAVPVLMRELLDTEWQVRKVVATALEQIDPQWRNNQFIETALEVWVNDLTNLNPQVRKAAQEALDLLGPEWRTLRIVSAARTEWLTMLSSTSWQAQAAAADALGTLQAAAQVAIPKLILKLGSANAILRRHAASALAQINVQWYATPAARQTVPSLAKMLAYVDPDVRMATATTLAQLGQNAPGILPALLNALTDEVPRVRNAALQAISKQGSIIQSVIPNLVMMLIDSDVSVRHTAAGILNTIDPQWHDTPEAKAAIPLLETALLNSDPSIHKAALAVLNLMAVDVTQILARLLTNVAWGVRRAAADLLGATSQKVPVDLVLALVDASWVVRKSAIDALNKIDPAWRETDVTQSAIPGLVQKLVDADAEVRQATVQALEQINPRWQELAAAKLATPVLIGAAVDANVEVRQAALWALTHIVPKWLTVITAKAAIPKLLQALTNSDALIRQAAVEMLERIGPQWCKTQEANESIPILTQALTEATAWEVRQTAAEIVGSMGAEAKSAIPALVIALADTDWLVRRSAILALGTMGKLTPSIPGIIPALMQSIKDKDWLIRKSALEILGALGLEPNLLTPILTSMMTDTDADVRNAATMLLHQSASAT